MEEVAAVLFALAALGGLYLAVQFFQGRGLPGSVAVIHGVLAASALVLLLIAVLANDLSGWATAALIVFVVAALGGFALASYHLRGIRHPAALVAGHGLIAVSGFVLLLVAILGA